MEITVTPAIFPYINVPQMVAWDLPEWYFSVKPLKSTFVAKYAIDEMFKNKMMIIPGFKMKCAKFFSRFISDKQKLKITYKIQKKKASE